MAKAAEAPLFQRNALAPSLLVAIFLFLSPLLTVGDWPLIVLFVVTIFAVIVGWYAVQARQWWWIPIFVAIAVLWNPIFPLPLGQEFFSVAAPIAAVVFIVAGALIKTPRIAR